jgi:flagellar hook-associated protein 1 FlgK
VISNNSAPFDDNRNGLAMSLLQTTKTIENSSTDFQSAYGIIVSDVGTKTHSAEVDLLAQQTLSEQAKAERESYSGVNLDEEAADLLKFQQAYQASARVISIADEMFNTLINAVG